MRKVEKAWGKTYSHPIASVLALHVSNVLMSHSLLLQKFCSLSSSLSKLLFYYHWLSAFLTVFNFNNFRYHNQYFKVEKLFEEWLSHTRRQCNVHDYIKSQVFVARPTRSFSELQDEAELLQLYRCLKTESFICILHMFSLIVFRKFITGQIKI